MAGALLGLIAGAGLGIAGHEVRQQHEQNQAFAQLVAQQAMQDPSILQSPDAQKAIKTGFGKSGVDILGAIGKAHQAANQAFSQQTQQPQQLKTVQDWQGYQQKLMQYQAQAGGTMDPRHAEILKDEISQTHQNIQQLQQNQEFQQRQADTKENQQANREQHAEFRKDIDANAAAARETAAGLKEVALAQIKSEDDFKNALAKSSQDAAKARDADERQMHLQAASQKISDYRDKVAEGFQKATTFEAKTASGARANGYNDSALNFFTAHPDSSPPTLLKFTPGTKGTMGIGGTDPALETIEPAYKTYQGKPGWSYDLGTGKSKFVPDAGS